MKPFIKRPFEVGDRISFTAVNGLFYSTKSLSKNKVYEVTYVRQDPTYNYSGQEISVKNDDGVIVSITSGNLKDIQLIREEKLEDLLGDE